MKIDKCEVIGDFKIVHIREVDELSGSFNRRCICPTDDVSGETEEIQILCATVHTQAVKDAYAAALEA